MFRGVLFVVSVVVSETEGRVYCTDKNSLPWTTTGYSCPLKCANVITAVDYLPEYDFERFLEAQGGQQHQDLSHEDESHQSGPEGNNTCTKNTDELTLTRRTLIEYAKVFKKKPVSDYLEAQLPLFKASNTSCEDINRTISNETETITNDKLCSSRRTEMEDFIKRLTAVLNKYAHADYEFNEGMTKLLLKKTLGQDVELRLSVPRVLRYVRGALKWHRTAARHRPPRIVLASRHCLTVHVPGCYCRNGYVEMIGQCITPEECLNNSKLSKKNIDMYLPRLKFS